MTAPVVDVVLLAVVAVAASIGLTFGYAFARARTFFDVKEARKDALAKSRSTIRGQVAEQLAPLLDGFPFEPGDARFLGAPIDYVVFDGLEEDREIEVILVEVKTGRSRLSSNERRVKDAVDAGRVRFETVRL